MLGTVVVIIGVVFSAFVVIEVVDVAAVVVVGVELVFAVDVVVLGVEPRVELILVRTGKLKSGFDM